jgi:hypothetical protein
MWISTQGSTATSYGTLYEFPTLGYNSGNTNGLYAGIYYDSNNTTYYGDFENISSMYGVAVRGDTSSTDSRNQIFFWGGGDTTTSAIGFKANGGEFPNPTGNGDGYNTYFTMDTDGRGWVFRRSPGSSDFSTAYTSGWILNNGVWQANASMRAPIFYDSNDTGYYLDPNSTSNSALRIRGGALHGPNPTWGAYLYVGTDGRPSSDASVCATNGNLHIDCANGYDSYFNYYSGRPNLFYGDARAPIFYDLNNTGYYFDGNSTSRWTTSNQDGFHTFNNYGLGVVGLYASTRFQCVFAMGDAYKGNADGTSLSGAYGLWWSYPSAGGPAANLSSHGLMCIVNGSFYASLDASTRAISDMRTPIYYDLNDTGYYLNPNSTTQLHYVLANNWFRAQGDTGFYTQDYGGHFRRTVGASHGTWEIFGYNKNGYAGLNIQDSSGYYNNYMHENGNGGLYQENGSGWIFYWLRGNSCLGIGTSTTSASYKMYVGGAIYSTGNIVAYSDARKKTNIVTVDNALDTVAKLRGVYYNRIETNDEKVDPNKRQIGVIAQEVNEVLPEVVTYAKDVDEYGVQYGNMAGLFIEAIKELKAEIEELKQRLR